MTDIYIYKYLFNNQSKVLSAWMRFTVRGSVRSIKFFDSSLYVVSIYNGKVLLEKMDLDEGADDGQGFITYLDKRVKTTVTAGTSNIYLPYNPKEGDDVQVYTTDGLIVNHTRVGSAVTLTTAPEEDTTYYVGFPYNMKYTFSEQVFKAASGNTTTPSNATKLVIRNGSIFYNDSSYFKVTVQPQFRDSYVNIFTPDIVGSTTLGSLNLDSGSYRFPVFTKAEKTKISIENDSALPSNLTSAEFESFTHSRSQRYG